MNNTSGTWNKYSMRPPRSPFIMSIKKTSDQHILHTKVMTLPDVYNLNIKSHHLMSCTR